MEQLIVPKWNIRWASLKAHTFCQAAHRICLALCKFICKSSRQKISRAIGCKGFWDGMNAIIPLLRQKRTTIVAISRLCCFLTQNYMRVWFVLWTAKDYIQKRLELRAFWCAYQERNCSAWLELLFVKMQRWVVSIKASSGQCVRRSYFYDMTIAHETITIQNHAL